MTQRPTDAYFTTLCSLYPAAQSFMTVQSVGDKWKPMDTGNNDCVFLHTNAVIITGDHVDCFF